MSSFDLTRKGGGLVMALFRSSVVVVLLLAALALPGAAYAQQASGIAGLVEDNLGGVLPGVTVEVASPALIEGTRTAFTDGEGRYTVTNLPPGTYDVTFSLPGFSTVVQEGIELASGFTATIDAAMQVGGLEETVTVTGVSPLVDVQNVRQQTRVTNELRAALPSGGQGLMAVTKLVPGMTSALDQGGGGALGIYGSNQSTSSTYHGKGSTTDSYDGMQVNNLSGIGSVSYVMNPATVSETAIQTGGISAENMSGFAINMIPKEGGNEFSGSFDGTYTGENFQNSNVEKIRDRGIQGDGQKNLHGYDANFTLGGPIREDRVWFFAAMRLMGTKNQVPDRFFNATQGTPIYTPDFSKPHFNKDWLRSGAVRITAQVSEQNKVNLFGDTQYFQTRGWQDNAAPEAQICWDMWPQGVYQGTWTWTATSRILVEAGAGLTKGPFPCNREQRTELFGFTVAPDDVSIQEATTGYRYNAASNYLIRNDNDRYMQRASVSYVTGSHNFKAGFTLQEHINNRDTERNLDQNWRFRRGLPERITLYTGTTFEKNRTNADLGIYAQDQWVIDRLTLNLGIRFDYFNGGVRAQTQPGGLFAPSRSSAEVLNKPNWTDINPRIGASYDLFGDGRTALKGSFGRYVGKEAVSVARAFNPVFTEVLSTNRSWRDANGNYHPDCDLTDFAANGECGAISNELFGRARPDALEANANLTEGFGNRDYYWDTALELQHELAPGMSLLVGYYRNWSDHFRGLPRGDFRTVYLLDNTSITADDFEHYCITAPVDSRLPDGGGYEVCGLYDITPEKFGVGREIAVRPGDFGNQSRISDFITTSLNTRFDNGVELGGSLDFGQTIEDRCLVIDSPQQLLHCRTDRGWGEQLQVKLHGVLPLPGDFVLSGTFQNLPGAPWMANYTARSAEIAPSLGRPLAGGTRSASVPLIEPFTLFEPRRTLFDLRVSKVFPDVNGVRLQLNLDVYNVLNDASILSVNGSYGGNWLRPSSRGIAAPRLIQMGGRLTF